VTLYAPAARFDLDKTAFPLESDACPRSVVPFMNFTRPVGTAVVPLVFVTVAVKVTVVP
jgi:hypothetical protein